MRPSQAQYKEVLERARKRFSQAVNAEREIRAEALIDLNFLSGLQWDPKVQMDRERGPSPRPCLVFNKVLPPVTQLGNQARQNKPAVQVSPVDSSGDVETAQVYQGMIRHIEYDSDADQAYDTALFYAAGCSFGYWRYTCERLPKSFDQEIKAVTVEDPFSIYLDCNARKPDRSDMKWAFVIDKMANDAYVDRFGEDTADLSSEFTLELEEEGWRDDDSKRVCEYWELETEPKTLRTRRNPDGTLDNIYLEDLGEDEDPDTMSWILEDEDDPDSKPLEAVDDIPVIKQYIINGAEVLEEPVIWDGSTIPIVIVTGLEMVVRGKKKIFSMTRFARDPQQLLNFYKTMEAETISLAPKPKYVGAVGQFKTKRRDWARANTDNAAYLEYDPVAVGDKLVGEPQWRTFDPPVQSLAIGAQACIDDIKASTGYFDPSLGEVKGDQSGVAIGKLQKQGDVSNFHFMDNLARALKRGGRILVNLIPKKYDTDREVRIIGEDRKESVIRVNSPGTDDKGNAYHYKLDVGRYDVRVQQGTSYEGQRDEVRQMIMAIAQGDPQVWALAADVFFENQDFVGADRLAKRFHAMLPPPVLAQEDDGKNGQGSEEQLRTQLGQMQQQLQGTQQANQQMMELLKTKVLDLESRERIATQNNLAKLEAAYALSKNSQINQIAQLDHQAIQAELDRRADLLHKQIDIEASAQQDAQEAAQAQQAQAMDQAHQQGMAAQGAQNDAQQASAQQQHDIGMQADQQAHQTDTAAGQQQHQQSMQTAAQRAQAEQAAALKAKPPAHRQSASTRRIL